MSAPQIDVTGVWLAEVYEALAEAGIEPPASVQALPDPKPGPLQRAGRGRRQPPSGPVGWWPRPPGGRA